MYISRYASETEFFAAAQADAIKWFNGGASHIKFRRDGDLWDSAAKIVKPCKRYVKAVTSSGRELRVSYHDICDYEWWGK